ncbi:glycerophosphoryl diester phosphodiesterase [Pedobacter xixiisoli]|uniref:Glycerophosphoryl diester phosphodiesterase n=2 Tax=Pedobacter xixiisoli TaxID=1476464 RepID=A0A286A8V4_9SPHI|nr:glycerophosphodiester phosphodiesterase family protein [Pedobacter xixiisoli]SOD18312.1 glycerophosphoryl diester phosphodiesterase [Pedobacter xixiisoli]
MRMTKSTLAFALFYFIAVFASAQSNQLQEITKSLYNPAGKEVLVVVHRGDWRNAPENSIKAIENTIKLGADMVEIDIQKTKDDQLILMHDKTLNRTTTGKGNVADFTLEDIKKLYLKSGIGIETHHKIPTLEEAMLVTKGKILVNIDKGYNHFDEVYKILERTGTLKQTVVKSGSDYSKIISEKGEAFLKQVIFMPVVNLDKPVATAVIKEYTQKLKPVAFELVFNSDTSKIINQFNEIKKNGSRVWVNTLWPSLNAGHHDDLAVDEGNLKDSWDWIIAKGVNIIQTDRPAELLNYLRKKKLHR